MRRILFAASIVLPLFLAVVLLVVPKALPWLTGFRPLKSLDLAALESRSAADDRETPRFLAARNQVKVKIATAIEVGDFLDLYQIRFEHVRRQIATQLGLGAVDDDTLLKAGQELVLELTPPGEPL